MYAALESSEVCESVKALILPKNELNLNLRFLWPEKKVAIPI